MPELCDSKSSETERYIFSHERVRVQPGRNARLSITTRAFPADGFILAAAPRRDHADLAAADRIVVAINRFRDNCFSKLFRRAVLLVFARVRRIHYADRPRIRLIFYNFCFLPRPRSTRV